jgi:hypothetical protein
MRIILLSCFSLALVLGQTSAPKDNAAKDKDTSAAPESAALKAARHRFMLVSTHAIALFQSADTIEARLQAEGQTLRPSTTALRLRIVRTLDLAEAALNKEDVERANELMKVAEELVERFERRIGGE